MPMGQMHFCVQDALEDEQYIHLSTDSSGVSGLQLILDFVSEEKEEVRCFRNPMQIAANTKIEA